MRENINGSDVGSKEKETLLALSERLDNLLDSSLELSSLGS